MRIWFLGLSSWQIKTVVLAQCAHNVVECCTLEIRSSVIKQLIYCLMGVCLLSTKHICIGQRLLIVNKCSTTKYFFVNQFLGNCALQFSSLKCVCSALSHTLVLFGFWQNDICFYCSSIFFQIIALTKEYCLLKAKVRHHLSTARLFYDSWDWIGFEMDSFNLMRLQICCHVAHITLLFLTTFGLD